MSFDAMRWAAAQQAPTTPKLILLILANKANEEGECWPSMATIAREASLSRRQVIRCLAKLKKLGLVTHEHRYAEGIYRSNRYTLAMPTKARLKIVGGSDI